MHTRDLAPIEGTQPAKVVRTSIGQASAIRQARDYGSPEVGHLHLDQVRAMAEAARRLGRGAKGERDALLIEVLCDACLRISEVVGASEAEIAWAAGRPSPYRLNPRPGLRPMDIVSTSAGWGLYVLGKRNKAALVAVSPSVAAKLQALAYRESIAPDARLFPMTRKRAWVIVQRAMREAGVRKPDRVGTVHVLRHTGAIARLDLTRNPKSVQDQLRLASLSMVIRYMKTLTADEGRDLQRGVELGL